MAKGVECKVLTYLSHFLGADARGRHKIALMSRHRRRQQEMNSMTSQSHPRSCDFPLM